MLACNYDLEDSEISVAVCKQCVNLREAVVIDALCWR